MKDSWENWAKLMHENRIYEAIEMRKRLEKAKEALMTDYIFRLRAALDKELVDCSKWQIVEIQLGKDTYKELCKEVAKSMGVKKISTVNRICGIPITIITDDSFPEDTAFLIARKPIGME